MDAVKAAVEELGGEVVLHSELGVGSITLNPRRRLKELS